MSPSGNPVTGRRTSARISYRALGDFAARLRRIETSVFRARESLSLARLKAGLDARWTHGKQLSAWVDNRIQEFDTLKPLVIDLCQTVSQLVEHGTYPELRREIYAIAVTDLEQALISAGRMIDTVRPGKS